MAKILIVDDSRFSRKLIVGALQSTEYEIIQAEDGVQGLAMIEQHHPDCVVSDLLMPNMDGVDLLRKVRSDGSDIPIIIVSADIQQSSRQKCEELGVSGFLSKPFDRETLLACIDNALQMVSEQQS